MSIFQIVAILFGLFMTYVISIHGKKKTLSFIEVSFWTSLWVIFIVVALFPSLLIGMADVFSFSRVFDFLVVISLMILSILIFLSYFQQKTTNRQLEELTREMALYKRVSKAEPTKNK